MINSNAVRVLLLFIGVFSLFLPVGIWFLRTPTERLLEWDRRTGYWLYQQELKCSGDKKVAIESAGCFYTLFGWTWVVFCSFCLLILVSALVAHLAGLIDIKSVPNSR